MTRQLKAIQQIVAKSMLLLAVSTAPLFLMSVTGLGADAYAAEEKKKESKYGNAKTKTVKALAPNVAKKLAKITGYLETEPPQFADAKSALEATESRAKKWGGYAQAQYWNLYAYYYYSVDDVPRAIRFYEKVLSFEDDLPEAFTTNTLYQVAQLYYSIENYKKAISVLLKWMGRAEIVSAKQKVFLSQAYYQIEDMNNSLRWVQEAIADVEAKGDIPVEGWWGLERAIYYEKKNYTAVGEIFEKLVTYYPKAKYWTQLAGVYSELGDDDKTLVAFDVLYIQKLLTKESRLKGLAYMLLGEELPYRAAQVLKWGFDNKKIKRTADNLKLFGECYYSAAETDKAIPIMEEASSLSNNGELSARLASLYLNADKNQKSVNSARAAISKGGLKRTGSTYLTLGMALANLKKYDSAIKAFKSATKYQRTENTAKNWIKYAQSEKKRQAAITEGMKNT
jgi:tetratricopeptide (TPR) repeat protein